MPDLDSHVELMLTTAIKEHCDNVVSPIIAEGVGSRVIERTNEFGEKKGEAQTFTEYLVTTANNYLHEKVDYEGKTTGYSDKRQTRLTWLIDKHLHYRIQCAMEKAIAEIEKQIAPAIAETIRLQVDELSAKIVTKRR
jgi:hypothetical protein